MKYNNIEYRNLIQNKSADLTAQRQKETING